MFWPFWRILNTPDLRVKNNCHALNNLNLMGLDMIWSQRAAFIVPIWMVAATSCN